MNPTTNEQKKLVQQIMWQQARDKRNQFLEELRDNNITGAKYSSEVAEYDRENMQVFIP